jgi:hypothetical protein
MKILAIATVAGGLLASTASASAQDPCKGTYLLGEKVPAGCAQQPQDFRKWDGSHPATTTTPDQDLPIPKNWQVTCDAAGVCRRR